MIGLDWKLSDEAKEAIREIDNNRLTAQHRINKLCFVYCGDGVCNCIEPLLEVDIPADTTSRQTDPP